MLTISVILFKNLMKKDLNIITKIKSGIINSGIKDQDKARQSLKSIKKKQKV
jgi:hypothetical protein